ncbi:hypothetical protein ABZ787_09005, partial [Micrococcus luteus]
MAVSTHGTGESMRAPGPSAAAPSAASVADGAAGVVSASLPVVAVDGSLPAPPYRQIVDAVLAGVASGSLARGDRLPPVLVHPGHPAPRRRHHRHSRGRGRPADAARRRLL